MNRVIFQNGTLVSKAKVTIDGTIYEVEPEVYEGQTPLSAEVLNLMQELLIEGIYPVGSIYMSTQNTNPSVLLGIGTWERWGKGKVPVGIDEEDEDFEEAELTGGEKEHTLTIDEMPTHKHTEKFGSLPWVDSQGTGENVQGNEATYYGSVNTKSNETSEVGGSQAHNNMQPYITCYMWKRVS